MPLKPGRVLILGAGLVARPIARYFLADDGFRLTVASLSRADAETLVNDHPRGRTRQVDVSDPAQCEALIRESDVVISLVPYAFHVQVARCAIRHRVNMITASYVLPEMRALDDEARAAGVTILNELGLDPGLDHMSAMRIIDEIHDSGGSIAEFTSCCGGLPAPEAADNPWKYKFSWSPRGALLAARLSARHLERGRVISVPGEHLFEHARPYEVEGLGTFEIYPNRDSLRYIEAYGLREIETMLRATIRYPGWSETMRAVAVLGLLDVEPRQWPEGTTYADFTASFLDPADAAGELDERLARRLGLALDHPVLARLRWAGLLDGDALPRGSASPLGIVADRFAERMAYARGERDMVVLRHEILARWPERPAERRYSLLVAYGEPGGDSATARTVSLPAAIAGRLLLDGTLSSPGVQIPTRREIYDPILDLLHEQGIAFREWSVPG